MDGSNGACSGTRKDGTPCGAPALTPGGKCFHHDPQRAAERVQARQRGGQRRQARYWAVIQGGGLPGLNRPKLPSTAALDQPGQLTPQGLVTLLGQQIDRLTARPELTPRELDTLARLSTVYMRIRAQAHEPEQPKTIEQLGQEIQQLTSLASKLD